MQCKKKQSTTSAKIIQSNSKVSTENKSVVRKSYQKHSRKGTKEYQSFNLQSLMNFKYILSARQLAQKGFLYNINSLFYGNDSIYTGYSCAFSLQFKEAIQRSKADQSLSQYYILSKHSNENKSNKKFIETTLMETIQNKNQIQFNAKPIIHFHENLYPIMYQHMIKLKKYHQKIFNFQTLSSINREPKIWTKQLPTLVSVRDKQDSNLNTSQSFELRKLTQCIKQMFSKQNYYEKKNQKIIMWGNNKFQQITGNFITNKKSFPQCDFSSIQSISKHDGQNNSKFKENWCTDAQQNYGLGTLRRRYEQQRFSRLKKSDETSTKLHLGHKRNPTETLYNKQSLHEQPMTPKQSSRSVFMIAQSNIQSSPTKNHKKINRKKEVDINDAYLLRFQKKKPNTTNNIKENIKEKSKIKSEISRSNSKSKEKMKFLIKKK